VDYRLKNINKTQKRFGELDYPGVPGECITSAYQHFSLNENELSSSRRFLVNLFETSGFAKFYLSIMQYQRYGLRLEDCLLETEDVGKALTRIPKEDLSTRSDRIKRALVYSSSKKVLAKEKWTSHEEDQSYLGEYLASVVQDRRDLEAFRPR